MTDKSNEEAMKEIEVAVRQYLAEIRKIREEYENKIREILEEIQQEKIKDAQNKLGM